MVGDTNNGEWELGGWDEMQPAVRGGREERASEDEQQEEEEDIKTEEDTEG
jgi:transposase